MLIPVLYHRSWCNVFGSNRRSASSPIRCRLEYGRNSRYARKQINGTMPSSGLGIFLISFTWPLRIKSKNGSCYPVWMPPHWVAHTNFLVLMLLFKLRLLSVCRKEATHSANDSEARDACTCKWHAKAMCHMRRHRISCKGVDVQYEYT